MHRRGRKTQAVVRATRRKNASLGIKTKKNERHFGRFCVLQCAFKTMKEERCVWNITLPVFEFSISSFPPPLCSPHIHTHNNKTIFFFLSISLQSQSWRNHFFRQFTKVTQEQTSEHGHLAVYSVLPQIWTKRIGRINSACFFASHTHANIIIISCTVHILFLMVGLSWDCMQLLQPRQNTMPQPTSVSIIINVGYSFLPYSDCNYIVAEISFINVTVWGKLPLWHYMLDYPLEGTLHLHT